MSHQLLHHEEREDKVAPKEENVMVMVEDAEITIDVDMILLQYQSEHRVNDR